MARLDGPGTLPAAAPAPGLDPLEGAMALARYARPAPDVLLGAAPRGREARRLVVRALAVAKRAAKVVPADHGSGGVP